MNRLVLLVALVGCKSELNPAYCAAHPGDSRCTQSGDANVPDGAGSDSGLDATPICLGTAPFKVCLDDTPTADLSLATVINTNTSMNCLATQPTGWSAQNQPDACFMVGKNVALTGNYLIRGARPLVVFAADSVTLTGAFDLSAHRGGTGSGQNPAGYNGALCTQLTVGGDSTNGAGGGAGGSLGSKGGSGGAGGGAAAAPAIDQPATTTLHAGCPGSAGGTGDNQGTAGLLSTGGFGGGAMYIVAKNSITFAPGTIVNASGAAGVAGNHRTGGGGGGSGGMLVFVAPTITVTQAPVFIMANGGGAAAGGTASNDGKNGMDADDGHPFQVAPGGVMNGDASGGNGYAFDGTNPIDAQVGATGPAGSGGGGGGGGAGIIIASSSLSPASVSPPAQN
jgi:hypothetical protein